MSYKVMLKIQIQIQCISCCSLLSPILSYYIQIVACSMQLYTIVCLVWCLYFIVGRYPIFSHVRYFAKLLPGLKQNK